MRTLELFCGTKSFSKVAAERGHSTFTLDLNPDFAPDVNIDLRKWSAPTSLMGVDILWASPPCTGFSVASIGHHWTGGKEAYVPATDTARIGIELVKATLSKIEFLHPKWWFIENPRGVLRKLPFMQNMRRVTVTYCQYGDSRMKPTDIWTNVPAHVWQPKRMCKNGDRCHEAAPRGSRTGTQGVIGAKDRGRIPSALFHEIFDKLETDECWLCEYLNQSMAPSC